MARRAHRGGLRPTMESERERAKETAKSMPGDYMTNVGKAGLAQQQERMGRSGRLEAEIADTVSNESARAARQSKVAKKYNGAK